MSENFSHYDAAEYLKTDEDRVLYFDDCLEEGDPALIAHALGIIARAKGMTQLARNTGISREGGCIKRCPPRATRSLQPS